MLTIRKAQRDAFTEDRFLQLRAWLHPHLRRHFGARLSPMADETLHDLIADSVERARALGATKSSTICHFVHLRVIFGHSFETLQWAAQTLKVAGLSGDLKIELLSIRARDVLMAARGQEE